MRTADGAELLLLAAIWGGSFLMMRVAVPEFGPLPMIALRTGIAAMVLLPVIFYRRQWPLLLRNWQPLTVLGATNSALPFALFAFAIQNMSAGVASILNATAPMFAAIVAWRWLGERPTAARSIGLAVGFGGVLILVGGRSGFQFGSEALASALVLAATFSYGFAANYARVHAKQIDSLAVAAGSQLVATLMLLPLAFAALPTAMPGRMAWGAAILLGVVCTGLAYVLYFRLIARIGATRAIAVTFLIPAFGMLWGWIFLGEAVTPGMIGGALLILCGTALTAGLLKWRPGNQAAKLDA